MMTDFYTSSSSGLYLYLNAAEFVASVHQEMTIQTDLTLQMLNIWFSDVKGFADSNFQQTEFQEQQLLVDVCL